MPRRAGGAVHRGVDRPGAQVGLERVGQAPGAWSAQGLLLLRRGPGPHTVCRARGSVCAPLLPGPCTVCRPRGSACAPLLPGRPLQDWLVALTQLPESLELVGAAPCSAPGLTLVLPEAPGHSPHSPSPVSQVQTPQGSGMCGVWPRFRGRGRVSSVPASGPLAVRVHPSGRQADRRVGSQWRWLQAQPDPRAQSAVSALRTRPVSPGSASGGSSPPEEASLRQLQTSRLGWEHPRLPLPPAARRRAGHGVGLVGGSSHQASAPLREATPFSPSTRPQVGRPWPWLRLCPRAQGSEPWPGFLLFSSKPAPPRV